ILTPFGRLSLTLLVLLATPLAPERREAARDRWVVPRPCRPPLRARSLAHTRCLFNRPAGGPPAACQVLLPPPRFAILPEGRGARFSPRPVFSSLAGSDPLPDFFRR